MDKVIFIDTNAETTLADLKADYEGLSGKKLQPGQVEALLIQAAANRITLLKIGINEAANQNFVDFAIGAGLDYLGVLVGVTRLPPASAQCLLQFNLVAGHGILTIPLGIRVQSVDGQLVFITTESKAVAAEDTTAIIKASCQSEGIAGNDYEAGDISVILDPLAYVSTVENIDTTAGGSDEETDEEMRERIKLAPSQFSVAGPDDAYKFHAKSAHPLIIDVAVTSPDPGDVYIYPLLLNGETPSTEIIDAVYAACNSKKVRPLTDTVYVEAPTKIDYDIDIELVVLNTAVESQVLALVNANLDAYKADRKTRLGVDVVINQLVKCAMVAGVYDVTVVSPSADIVAEANEFTEALTTTVTVTGTTNE